MIDDSRKALRLAIAFCVGLFIVTCGFCIRAVLNLATEPVSESTGKSTAVSAGNSTPVPAYRKPVTAVPAPHNQASSTPVQKPKPRISNEFLTDYAEIRKIENAQKKQSDNLRKYAQEHPEAEDAMTEEKIQEIEDKHLMVQ